MIHYLKSRPDYFKKVKSKEKKHEIRETNDRTFYVGDIIILQEWDTNLGFTAQELTLKITYVSNFLTMNSLPKNLNVLSIEVVDDS